GKSMMPGSAQTLRSCAQDPMASIVFQGTIGFKERNGNMTSPLSGQGCVTGTAIHRRIPRWPVRFAIVILAMIQITGAVELTWEYSVQGSATMPNGAPSTLVSSSQDVATPDYF